MSHTVEKQLNLAARGGRAGEVESLLKDNPGLDVNWGDRELHQACFQGHAEVVKLLLGHPGIKVNLSSSGRQTPLLLGCWKGHVSVVRMLLKDSLVSTSLSKTAMIALHCGGQH